MNLDTIVKTTPIGQVTPEIVSLLTYPHAPGTILIGPSNVAHMKQKHLRDYSQYGGQIAEILNYPDYVGVNPTDGSIQFIKVFDRKVAVAVRVSTSGQYFARSIYALLEGQFNSYMLAGRLFKV